MTPQEALEQLVLAISLMPGAAPAEPGGLVRRFPEDGELRKVLRGLTSDDTARTSLTHVYAGVTTGTPPGARQGRYSMNLPRCSVLGCQLLRPVDFKGVVQDDGTCGRHRR